MGDQSRKGHEDRIMLHSKIFCSILFRSSNHKFVTVLMTLLIFEYLYRLNDLSTWERFIVYAGRL